MDMEDLNLNPTLDVKSFVFFISIVFIETPFISVKRHMLPYII